MTRVLFVSTSTTQGGAEKTLYTLATLLDPQRFTVAGVVSLKRPGGYAERLAAAGFSVRSLELEGRPGWKEFDRLCALIGEASPDVVHAVMYQAIQLCRLAKRRLGGFKLVSSPRVNYRTRSWATLAVDRLLKGADDMLVAESKSSRDYLVGRLGYAPSKVRTVYNGIDLAGWSVSKLERRQKRLELRLAAGELLIGTAGRLDAQKGQAALIEAMARLKGVPARCVILGEGPERPALEARIRRLGLEGQVWLLGERDDMPSWLSALDVFVLPSLWEGLPNALLEAMAMGLPVVASAVDGVREVVSDGKSGLLVSPKDPRELAARLASLCGDPDARARLGAAAKAAVSDRFSLISMLEAYQDVYRSLGA